MLFAINNNGSVRQVRTISHATNFSRRKNRLAKPEYEAICEELNNRIDGDEIHTAGWIPGADWTGTVFEPIYRDACNRDVGAAARFFGLIVWKVMLERPERWSFGRYQKNGVPIESMTYFRIN